MNEIKQILIDIIIPAYNAQEWIERTIASIVIQTMRDNIKVTIVNDCGDGDYSKVINRYSDILNIREIKMKENGGPGLARQYGIDNTTAPYFACIDSDDTYAGAFAIETLYKGILSDPKNVVCVGSSQEQGSDGNFYLHTQDMTWMGNKLYLRQYICMNNIRFNTTRANEDVGFNNTIKLAVDNVNYKILFLDNIVQYWHYKADSITRINNNEYTYNQSFPGYVENMIYSLREAKRINPFNGSIEKSVCQIMINLYVYYLQTKEYAPQFKEQNFEACMVYFAEIFRNIYITINPNIFKIICAEELKSLSSQMDNIVPEITIYQFLSMLNEEFMRRNIRKEKEKPTLADE